jgi:hypothetical protein
MACRSRRRRSSTTAWGARGSASPRRSSTGSRPRRTAQRTGSAPGRRAECCTARRRAPRTRCRSSRARTRSWWTTRRPCRAGAGTGRGPSSCQGSRRAHRRRAPSAAAAATAAPPDEGRGAAASACAGRGRPPTRAAALEPPVARARCHAAAAVIAEALVLLVCGLRCCGLDSAVYRRPPCRAAVGCAT